MSSAAVPRLGKYKVRTQYVPSIAAFGNYVADLVWRAEGAMGNKLVFKAVTIVAHALAGSPRRLQHGGTVGDWRLRWRDGFAEFVRRVRRGGLIFLGLVGALLGYGLLAGPIDLLLWIVAAPLAVVAGALSLLWPSRHRGGSGSAMPPSDIAALARRTHLRLARSMQALPPDARSALKSVLRPLRDIASTPAGAVVDPVLKSEAERLIGGHLPRLVESYCSLSLAERSANSEASQHVVLALGTFAMELESVRTRIEKAGSQRFDVERRFVELRFRHDTELASR